jgi:ABC-type bacteriocin/lantibiotic exporter with double-glycine peptidase domain
MIKHITQRKKKGCNLACIQMVGSYFEKTFTEQYILTKLPQHSYGNSLKEIAQFLESEGILTNVYKKTENLKPLLNEKPAILAVDRTKLYKLQKKRTPHFIVIEKNKVNLTVYDPLNEQPVQMEYEEVFQAAIDIKRQNNNEILMVCSIINI